MIGHLESMDLTCHVKILGRIRVSGGPKSPFLGPFGTLFEGVLRTDVGSVVVR